MATNNTSVTLTFTAKEFEILSYITLHANRTRALHIYLKKISNSEHTSAGDMLKAINNYKSVLRATGNKEYL